MRSAFMSDFIVLSNPIMKDYRTNFLSVSRDQFTELCRQSIGFLLNQTDGPGLSPIPLPLLTFLIRYCFYFCHIQSFFIFKVILVGNEGSIFRLYLWYFFCIKYEYISLTLYQRLLLLSCVVVINSIILSNCATNLCNNTYSVKISTEMK